MNIVLTDETELLRNFVAIWVINGNNRLCISGRLVYIWSVNWSNKKGMRFFGFECESAVILLEMQNVIEGDLFTELSPVPASCRLPILSHIWIEVA